MSKRRTTILRKKEDKIPFKDIDDAQRYDILRKYRLGTQVKQIAGEYNIEEAQLKTFISSELKGLNTIKETNELINSTQGLLTNTIDPTKMLNKGFLDNVDDKKDAYAYYYAMTGSNEEALRQSGLNKWIPRGTPESSKRYIFSVRGKYLRDLAPVASYISQVRADRIKELKVTKPDIQHMTLEQIEELRELVADDNRLRKPLLDAIKMLGQTIGAFTENIKVEEVSAKSGLELLMEKAKQEAEESTTSTTSTLLVEDGYTITDTIEEKEE